VLLAWGILVEEDEHARSAPNARFWTDTNRSTQITHTYRAVRTEARQERGRFMWRLPRRDEDVADPDGPHYRESALWARLEWPNGGRNTGYWALSGVPFTGSRPPQHVVEETLRALRTACDILAAGPPSRGRHEGAGALWPGGLDDFLNDLWTTLEMLTGAAGTPFGHDPAAKRFRDAMRERPGETVLRQWMRKAGIKCQEVKAGKVTRANYAQFVTK
jgi:hypothetical protein